MKYGKYDRDASLAYAVGVFPSLELARSRPGAARALLYDSRGVKNEGLDQLIAFCEERRLPIEEAPRALQRISGKENTYAALVFEKYEDALSDHGDHIVLCGISDMGNLGTVLRTGLGFGFEDVAVILPAADPFDPRTVRASMGALFGVRLRCYASYDAYIADVGVRPEYFFRLTDAAPLHEVTRSTEPVSLVFGNEATGLTGELTRRPVGVRIPHESRIDSLNLAVAAGIGLYAMKGRV